MEALSVSIPSKNSTYWADPLLPLPEFNKLAHLDHNVYSICQLADVQSKVPFKKSLFEKKIVRKAFTQRMAIQLINHARNHRQKERFLSGTLVSTHLWNMYNCCSELAMIDGYLQQKRCKSRACSICGAAKTANVITNYQNDIKKIKTPVFLTLTVPNVFFDELRPKIDDMTHQFTLAIRKLKRSYGRKIKAMRKIEVTYNSHQDNYHPHIHCIVESKIQAKMIINHWLKVFPHATNAAQDFRAIKKDQIIEVCKYEMKMPFSEGKIMPDAAINILLALENKRCLQVYGMTKQLDRVPEENTFKEWLSQEVNVLEVDNYKTEETLNCPHPVDGLYVYDPYRLNWFNDHIPILPYKMKYLPDLKLLNNFNSNIYLDVILKHRKPLKKMMVELNKKIDQEKKTIQLAKKLSKFYPNLETFNQTKGKLDRFNNYQCNFPTVILS